MTEYLAIKSVETAEDETFQIIVHLVDHDHEDTAMLTLDFVNESQFDTKLRLFDIDYCNNLPIINHAHLTMCILKTLYDACDTTNEIPYVPEFTEPLVVTFA